MELELVDLVGSAPDESVPPSEVVVDLVLGGVLDEDEGLGLKLEVRVDDQGGHLFLGPRALPRAAERVRQECRRKVPVRMLHYFF